jgi:hypothetical protein
MNLQLVLWEMKKLSKGFDQIFTEILKQFMFLSHQKTIRDHYGRCWNYWLFTTGKSHYLDTDASFYPEFLIYHNTSVQTNHLMWSRFKNLLIHGKISSINFHHFRRASTESTTRLHLPTSFINCHKHSPKMFNPFSHPRELIFHVFLYPSLPAIFLTVLTSYYFLQVNI